MTSSAASTPTIAETLLPAARAALWFAENATADIPADQFARCPEGIKTSSPAFIMGHLATYPDRLLQMLGLPAQDQSRFTELFAAGKECRDDATGSLYPPKEEVLKVFFERHRALLEALPGVDESVLGRANPNEKMRETFPTVGAMLSFMLLSHTFMHLGQLSTWRRVMGLGSVMR